MRHRAIPAAAAALLAGAAATVAQPAELVRRTSNVFGNFVVGYAALGDGGSFGELLFTLESLYARDAADAGAVSGDWNGTPVQGSASFASGVGYVFDPAQVVGSGYAITTGETPYDHVSLGANSIGMTRLEFTVDVITPFVITGAVSHTLGPNPGARVSEALASVQFTGCIGCLWRSDTSPGSFMGSGTLIPGVTYTISGNATTRLNGDAQWAFNLQLSPVPEPAVWLLLAMGLPALLWQRARAWGERT